MESGGSIAVRKLVIRVNWNLGGQSKTKLAGSVRFFFFFGGCRDKKSAEPSGRLANPHSRMDNKQSQSPLVKRGEGEEG